MENLIPDNFIPEQIQDIMDTKKISFEKALEEAIKINEELFELAEKQAKEAAEEEAEEAEEV